MMNAISAHAQEPPQESPNVAHDILLENNILHRVLQLAGDEGIETLLKLRNVSEDMRDAVNSMNQDMLENIKGTSIETPKAFKVGNELIILTLAQRIALAQAETCSEDLLPLLAQDSNYLVQRSAIANPSMPVENLRILAQDDDPDVRATAARNLRLRFLR